MTAQRTKWTVVFFAFSVGCFAASPESDFNRGLAEAKAFHYDDAILAFGRALNRAENKADIEKCQLAMALALYDRALKAKTNSLKYAELQVAGDYLIELQSKGELPRPLRKLLEEIRLTAEPLRESTNKELLTLPWEPFAKQLSGYKPQSQTIPSPSQAVHSSSSGNRERAEQEGSLEEWVNKYTSGANEEELAWQYSFSTSALDKLDKEQTSHPVDRYSAQAPRIAWLAVRLAEIRAEVASKLAALWAANRQDFEARQRAKESETILKWLQAKAPRGNPIYPSLTKLIEQSYVETEKSAFLPIPYRTAEKTLEEKDGHFQAVHEPKARYYRLLLAHKLWTRDYRMLHAANGKSLRAFNMYAPPKRDSAEHTNGVILSDFQSGSERAFEQTNAKGTVGSQLTLHLAQIDQAIQKAVDNLPPQTPPTGPPVSLEKRRQDLLEKLAKLDFAKEAKEMAKAHGFLRKVVEKHLANAKPDALARAEEILAKSSESGQTVEKLFQDTDQHWKDLADLAELKNDGLTRLKVAEMTAAEVPLETRQELLDFRDRFLKDSVVHSPKTGDAAWKMISRLFSAHSLPTHTIGDLSKSRELLTQQSDPSASGTESVREEDKDRLTALDSAPQDTSDVIGVDTHGSNALMGVFAPPGNNPLFVQSRAFRLQPNRRDHSTEGVPPTPEPTIVTNLGDKLWVRHLLPASGQLSLPTGAKPEKVLLDGADVTGDVKFDSLRGTFFLPHAKGHVEIDTLLNVHATYESIQAADAPTRAFYLRKPPLPALHYPDSLQKRLTEIRKEREEDKLGTSQDKDLAAAQKVIDWMMDNFEYSTSPQTAHSYQAYLNEAQKKPSLTILNHLIEFKKGDCDVFNAFFVRVLNEELKIPARSVSGYQGKNGKIGGAGGHGWSEIWVRDRGWLTADATVKKRNGLASTEIGQTENRAPSDVTALYRCLKEYAVREIEKTHSLAVFDWKPENPMGFLVGQCGVSPDDEVAKRAAKEFEYRSFHASVLYVALNEKYSLPVGALAYDWLHFGLRQLLREDVDFSKTDTFDVLRNTGAFLGSSNELVEYGNAVGHQLAIGRIGLGKGAQLANPRWTILTTALHWSDFDKGLEKALRSSLAKGVAPDEEALTNVFKALSINFGEATGPILDEEKKARLEGNWNASLMLLRRAGDKNVISKTKALELALSIPPKINFEAFKRHAEKEPAWKEPNFTPGMQAHFVQTFFPAVLESARMGRLEVAMLPFPLSSKQKTELLSEWVRSAARHLPNLRGSQPQASGFPFGMADGVDEHFRSFFRIHFHGLPFENYRRLLDEADNVIPADLESAQALTAFRRVLEELVLETAGIPPSQLPYWMDRVLARGPHVPRTKSKQPSNPLSSYQWRKGNIWEAAPETPREREALHERLYEIENSLPKAIESIATGAMPIEKLPWLTDEINKKIGSIADVSKKPKLSARDDATQLWEMLQNIPDATTRKQQFDKVLGSHVFWDRHAFLTYLSNIIRTSPDPSLQEWIGAAFAADKGSLPSDIKTNANYDNLPFQLELSKMRLWTQANEAQRAKILHNGQTTKLLNGLQADYKAYPAEALPLIDSILAPAHQQVLEAYAHDLGRVTDTELLDSRVGPALHSFLEWRSRFTPSRKETSALLSQSEAYLERRAKQEALGHVPEWWKEQAASWFKSHIGALPLSEATAENYQTVSRALTNHHLVLKHPQDAARDFNTSLNQFAVQAFRLPQDAKSEAILNVMTEASRTWIPQLSHSQRSSLALHGSRLWMEASPTKRAYYADVIERCISDLPRRELHHLMPALWNLAKISNKPSFARLIAEISLKPKVMDKLDAEEEHIERPQSELQRAPMQLLKSAIGPAAVFEPYRAQTPQQRAESLRNGPLSALLHSQVLGQIVLETNARPNSFLNASLIALSPADRLELLASIAGRGWVSASVLASAIDSLPTGTEIPEAVRRALLAGVARDSMATASRVLKNYNVPEAFSSMSIGEQTDFIQKEKPPIDLQTLKLLNKSLSRFGQTLAPYPSALPPVEERPDK